MTNQNAFWSLHVAKQSQNFTTPLMEVTIVEAVRETVLLRWVLGFLWNRALFSHSCELPHTLKVSGALYEWTNTSLKSRFTATPSICLILVWEHPWSDFPLNPSLSVHISTHHYYPEQLVQVESVPAYSRAIRLGSLLKVPSNLNHSWFCGSTQICCLLLAERSK